MKFRNIAAAAAALGLASAPVAAQPANERASAPIEQESNLQGVSQIAVVVLLAVFALAIGLIADNDDPVSA